RSIHAHHHGTVPAVGPAQLVTERLALEEAPREIPTQDGMAQRDQLARQEMLEAAHWLDRVAFGVRALERTLAARERVGAHAPEQLGQATQLPGAQQTAAELDLPARGQASTGAEAGAPGVDVVRHARELGSDLAGCHRELLRRGGREVVESLAELHGLL